MKILLKQKVISFKNKFNALDENGEPLFYIEGKVLSLGHKMTVTDNAGNEIAHINQKLLSLRPKYYITAGDSEYEFKQNFTLLKPHYTLFTDSGEWDIRGDFTEHEYKMTCNGTEIASVSKKWFSWGDCYMLDVNDDSHALAALCVMIAIDCINDDSAAAASSN